MKVILLLSALLGALSISAQTSTATSPAAGRFEPLSFLVGTWQAKTINNPAVTATGAYTFRPELNGHVLARHSVNDSSKCKGPEDFNCEHGDLLYIYSEQPGQPLRAIYFDNEGHVIHYAVTAPTASSAEFLSDASAPGPQFRLSYEWKGGAMNGKFQIRMPGQQDWKSYLEWTGSKMR